MQWNRELAGFIIIVLMIMSVIFLILKRKKLGETAHYFTFAIGLSTIVEVTGYVLKLWDTTYDTSSLYIIGTNFFVFLLFLIYFQSILQTKKFRTINLGIISIFIFNYILSAILVENYFTNFSFYTYFVQVILLILSIFLVLSQTFNSDKILVLSYYFPFYVCISLLVIYLGVMPLIIISKTASKLMNLTIFFAILFMVNLVGYSILLLGIAKSRTEN